MGLLPDARGRRGKGESAGHELATFESQRLILSTEEEEEEVEDSDVDHCNHAIKPSSLSSFSWCLANPIAKRIFTPPFATMLGTALLVGIFVFFVFAESSPLRPPRAFSPAWYPARGFSWGCG